MAYTVASTSSARLKYPQEECERLLAAKQFIQRTAGTRAPELDLLSGIAIPPDLAPRRAILRWIKTHDKQSLIDTWCEVTGKTPYEYWNPMRDVTNTHFGWLLSQRARDLIEALEPDVHQFFPFTVEQQNGTAIGRPFWLLNICNRIDAVVASRSTVVKVGPDLQDRPDDWWYIRADHKRRHPKLDVVDAGLAEDHPHRIVLSSDRIAERAIWADRRWRRAVFLSTAFGQMVQAASLDDITLSEIPED